MRKKKVPELPPKEETRKYICSWCGAEKPENKFFKCSLRNDVCICGDCVKKKYSEIAAEYPKMMAVLICCYYLNLAFDFNVFKTLKPDEGFGIYVRQLNLLQNKNPDDFPTGLLKGGLIQSATNHASDITIKQELTSVIEELERIRNGI